MNWGKAGWVAEMRCTVFFQSKHWKWDVFTGAIPLMGTYTIYLVSKFGMVVMWVHPCQHFRDSSLFVLYARQHSLPRVLRTLHPPPTAQAPKHHCGIASEVDERGRVGMEFSIMPKPIQADPCQSTMCVQTIQLNPTQCIPRPYLSKAKYTLSYQSQWMSDWNSQFFGKYKHIYYAPPLQAVQIKIMAVSRKNKQHAVWLLRNLENRTSHITQISPEVSKTATRPSPANSVAIRTTSDRANAGKDFIFYFFLNTFKGFAR